MTSHIICHKASDLCHSFHRQLERAMTNVLFRWLKSLALKYWMATHEIQISPGNLIVDTLDFMQHFRPKVSEQNRDPKYIVIMY